MRVPWRGYAQRRRRSFRAICFQCMRLGQEIDGMVTASRIDLEICWNFRGSWGCLRWLLHVAAHSWHRCTRLSQKLINDIYIYYDICYIYTISTLSLPFLPQQFFSTKTRWRRFVAETNAQMDGRRPGVECRFGLQQLGWSPRLRRGNPMGPRGPRGCVE